MRVTGTIDADHRGQFWFMIACGNQVRDDLPWVILQRAASDQSNGFLPSNPEIYAWRVRSLPGNGTVSALYHVPASFSCPTGEAVGRWIWKTGNTCNDANNVGRSTTTFNQGENAAIGLDLGVCESPTETFISCVDFKVESGGCCRFGASCGDCGEDGTGWCHQSASNCAVCTGSFDSSAPAPSCGGGGSPSPSPTPIVIPTPSPTPPSTGGQCCYGGGCSSCN